MLYLICVLTNHQWAENWSADNRCLFEEETQRRMNFRHDFKGHFLKFMFPGYQGQHVEFAVSGAAWLFFLTL